MTKFTAFSWGAAEEIEVRVFVHAGGIARPVGNVQVYLRTNRAQQSILGFTSITAVGHRAT
jgi:hypothetical protein